MSAALHEALARAMDFTTLVERHIRADLPEGVQPAAESEVADSMYALRSKLAEAVAGLAAPPITPHVELIAPAVESERDRLARTAMHGMLSFGQTEERSAEYIGRTSYEIADGMLKARKGRA